MTTTLPAETRPIPRTQWAGNLVDTADRAAGRMVARLHELSLVEHPDAAELAAMGQLLAGLAAWHRTAQTTEPADGGGLLVGPAGHQLLDVPPLYDGAERHGDLIATGDDGDARVWLYDGDAGGWHAGGGNWPGPLLLTLDQIRGQLLPSQRLMLLVRGGRQARVIADASQRIRNGEISVAVA